MSAVVMALVPPGPVTVMSTTDVAVPAGEVAVIEVFEFTVKLVAGDEPKLTVVAPVKPLPVIVTVSPPAGVPTVGVMELMTGLVAV